MNRLIQKPLAVKVWIKDHLVTISQVYLCAAFVVIALYSWLDHSLTASAFALAPLLLQLMLSTSASDSKEKKSAHVLRARGTNQDYRDRD